MKETTIIHGQGVGDFLIYSESVKNIYIPHVDKINLVYTNKNYLNSINQIYQDYKDKVQFIHISLCSGNAIDLGSQTYTFSFLLGSPYFLQKINVKRNYEKENEAFNCLTKSLGCDKYNIIHSRTKDNCGGMMQPINYESNISNDYPCINLDFESGDLEKYNIKFDNIFDYIKILEKAEEFHLYEGSFCHLVDRLDISGKKYCYLSCKNAKHTKYIKKLCQSGRWHRNKWSYIL